MREFPRIALKLDKEQKYLERLQENFGKSSGITGMKRKLTTFRTKIEEYQNELERYWEGKFPKKTLDLFKKLWATHH